MHKMSNIEIKISLNQLIPKIVGRHFRKIKKIDESIYRIKIGETDIICQLGVRIHETKIIEQSDLKDKFTEKVEKELDNRKLVSLTQINNDRIIEFKFDSQSLIFEMFGDGNAILINNGVCIVAHKYEKWSDRIIAAGNSYSPPKPNSGFELNDKYIISALLKLPYGKEYAQDILKKYKIDEKTPGNSIDIQQINQILVELKKLEIQEKCYGFFEKDKMIDFALIKLIKFLDNKEILTKEYSNIAEIADEYYSKYEKVDPNKEKLIRRLEKQKERLVELLKEEEEFRSKGDYIYENYQKIEKVLSVANKDILKLENLGIKIDKKDKKLEID